MVVVIVIVAVIITVLTGGKTLKAIMPGVFLAE